MRFLLPGLGFTLALSGSITPNLAAIALPLPPASSHHPIVSQRSIEATIIKGNGVKFTLPNGFQGGSPSDRDTQAIIQATQRMFPSMASFVQIFDRDPTLFRAIAIETVKSKENPSLILVTRLPLSGGISLKDLQVAMSKSIPTMLPPEFKLVDSRVVNVGSRQIVRLTLDVNIQGFNFKESIGLLKEGNEVFQVTYVFDNQNTATASTIFEGMIRTFKTTPMIPGKMTPVL